MNPTNSLTAVEEACSLEQKQIVYNPLRDYPRGLGVGSFEHKQIVYNPLRDYPRVRVGFFDKAFLSATGLNDAGVDQN